MLFFIALFFILGTGMIGAILAAWDCGNMGDVLRGLYTMGICYTAADVAYVVGVS